MVNMHLPGHPGGPNLRDAEIAAILDGCKRRIKRVEARELKMLRLYELVGEETGFDWKVIQRVWRMFQPTTGLAVDYIRARAFKLARKVVKDASVSEAMDILSRPNIGVLEPIKKQESGHVGGFIMSVQSDSLGAVSVGVAFGQQPQTLQLPAGQIEDDGASAPSDSYIETAVVESKPVDPMARHRPRAPGKSKAFEEALAAAQIRIAKRKKRAENTKKWRANKKTRQAEPESIG
jgi:hypothetical protein